MVRPKEFGELLTQAIRCIHFRENKDITIIQDEMGYAINKKGGASIDKWRRGESMPKEEDLEGLAREAVERCGDNLGREWLKKFLDYADYEHTEKLCNELFPGELSISNNDSYQETSEVILSIPEATPSKSLEPKISDENFNHDVSSTRSSKPETVVEEKQVGLIDDLQELDEQTKGRNLVLKLGIMGTVLVLILSIFILNIFSSDPEAILFDDDFQSGSSKWIIDSPLWEIRSDEQGNQFFCASPRGNYVYAFAGSTSWQNFALEVDVLIDGTSSDGSGQILIRVSDNYFPTYVYNFSASSKSDPNSELAKEIEISGNQTYQFLKGTYQGPLVGQWSSLRIETIKSDIKVFLDGVETPILQYTDNDNPIESGAFALGAGESKFSPEDTLIVCYDNVQVFELKPVE